MLAAAGACAAALWASTAVYATPVRGTVSLPSGLKGGRRHQGYWRLENGNVPIQPAAYRGDTVVVLEGLKGSAPSAKTVTVEIGHADGDPGAGAGPHLGRRDSRTTTTSRTTWASTSNPRSCQSNDWPPVRSGASVSTSRAVTSYAAPSTRTSRCRSSSSPRPTTPWLTRRAGSRSPTPPDGKGTLKVWSHGRWVHTEPVEVAGKGHRGPGEGDRQRSPRDHGVIDACFCRRSGSYWWGWWPGSG